MSDFTSEADMVEVWLGLLASHDRKKDWTVYAETAGWDLLLVHRLGFQLGLEAKLTLNAKVVAQALAGSNSYWRDDGPDYRGVLVPADKVQLHLHSITRAIGLGVLTVRPVERGVWRHINLPEEDGWSSQEWPHWCPARRCTVPDYIPDVSAGHASPIQLTPWKVKAIKLMLLLDRRGFVTRADMKALQISPTRWTDSWHGFLERGAGGFYRCKRTPDLKAQHPTNWAQIEADFEKWATPGLMSPRSLPGEAA